MFTECFQLSLVFSLKIDNEFRSILRSNLKSHRFEFTEPVQDVARVIGTYKYGASSDNQLNNPGFVGVQVVRGCHENSLVQPAGE